MGNLFFHRKTIYMTVCLIKEKDELQIHQVRPDQEMKFLAIHGDKILLSGNSIVEVLTRFDELPVIFCNGD
jgi:hypothetical protein